MRKQKTNEHTAEDRRNASNNDADTVGEDHLEVGVGDGCNATDTLEDVEAMSLNEPHYRYNE